MIVACVYVCERGEYGRGGGNVRTTTLLFLPSHFWGGCVWAGRTVVFLCGVVRGGSLQPTTRACPTNHKCNHHGRHDE